MADRHPYTPAVTNYSKEGKSVDPKRHPQGPVTSEKQSPFQIHKQRNN
jgi:hypothetical protein